MNTQAVYLIKRSRKLPSGKKATYYALRWYDSQGKAVEEAIGRIGARTRDGEKITQKYAEQRRREKELAIGSGRIRADKPRKMTLGEFLAADREAISGDVRESTIIEHRHAANHALAALGEGIELTRIGFPEVARIKHHMTNPPEAKEGERQKRPASPATVKKTLGTLRAAFNRASKQGLIHANPFAGLRMPKVESKSKRIFSPDEANAMIAATDDLWWKVLIRTAITSGLRRDELLNLRWDDIDEKAATITVQPKESETIDIAGDSLQTWSWHAKARASYRTIPIPAETIEAIQRLRLKSGGSPYVFIDAGRLKQLQRFIKDGKLPAKYDLKRNMLRDFQAIQRKAVAKMNAARPKDEPIRWKLGTLHDLRRSYCTHQACAGVPMHALRTWAGHADIATTAGFYLGMTDGLADRGRTAITLAAG